MNKPLVAFAVLAVLAAAGLRLAPSLLRDGQGPVADGAAAAPAAVDKPLAGSAAHPPVVSTPASAPESKTGERAPDFQTLLEQIAAAAVSNDWARIDRALAACVAKNPKGTAAYLDAARLGGNRELLLGRFAQVWSANDPVAALQWAVSRDDVGEQEFLSGTVYLKWAETDPASAVAAAEQVRILGTTRTDVMRNLVSQWAAQDLASTLAWVKARPVDDQRSQLIGQVAVRLAETSPAAAIALVQKEIAPGNRQREAILAVLHKWALHDLPAAKTWAASIPGESVMGKHVRQELDGIESGLAELAEARR